MNRNPAVGLRGRIEKYEPGSAVEAGRSLAYPWLETTSRRVGDRPIAGGDSAR